MSRVFSERGRPTFNCVGFGRRAEEIYSPGFGWALNRVFLRSILLGSRGYDVPKLSQKLGSLNAAKSLEPIEPVWEADIEVMSVVGVAS